MEALIQDERWLVLVDISGTSAATYNLTEPHYHQ